MKEFIKKFASASAADNYIINDIPFTTTIATNPIQNLVCNQTGKKLVNNEGIVSIYSDEPVIPNNEIWYTTTNGEPIDLSGGGSGSCSGSGSGWPEHTNTYEGGKGVIKFTEDLTEIPSEGFKNIGNLETITIPDSVISIGDYTFNSCTSLSSVTIGNSVTSIGSNAFSGCSSLTSVTCEATSPPTLGTQAFNGSNCSIYVPAASYSDYVNSDSSISKGWYTYRERIVEPQPEYKVFFINDEETTLTNNTFSQAGFNYQNKIFRKETGTEIIFDKNYENYIEVDYNSIPEENVYYYTQENVPIDALDDYIITNYLPWDTENRTYDNNIQIAVSVGFVCGWLDLLGNMHNSSAFTDCSKTIEEVFKEYNLIAEFDYFSIGMLIAEKYVSGEIKLSNPFSVVGFIDGYYQELWAGGYDFITVDEWDDIVATFDNIRDTYTMPYMRGGAKQMYDIDFSDWFVFAPKSFIGNILMLLLPESAECDINTVGYVDYILNKSRLISDHRTDDVPGLPHGLQEGVNLYEVNSELFH